MNHYDVVIIGGGLGGVAAALAAARLGGSVALVSECDWLGGQLTSQAIPLDEHPWIESTGCGASYRELRDRARAFYRRNYPLTAAARRARDLNPGAGNIGPLTFEPHVGALVIDELLAPHVSAGRVTLVREATVVGADVRGDELRAVHVAGRDGAVSELRGTTFLDATDLGDLIAHAGAEHVIGAESQAQTGEPHAPPEADPLDQQAFTWALALGFEPGADHTIARPRDYEQWRDYRTPVWPGSLLSFEVSDFVTHRTRHRPLFRARPSANGIHYDLWHARRILAAANFEPGFLAGAGAGEGGGAGEPERAAGEATAAAWPMQDYWRAPLLGVSDAERSRALEGSRQLSLSLLYWMQTEAPRHDGDGAGYPELRPRGDLTATADGLAKQPYIREGRRIVAEQTVLEQHIGVEARPGASGSEPFHDTVGVGAYRIDLHPSASGRDTVDIDSWPFEIPLGALLPVRLDNLLAAAKDVGTTHITNGAYRVHPVEWAIGEAAGALAVFAQRERVVPRAVRADGERLGRFQALLAGRLGAQLHWPEFGPLTPVRRWGYVPQEELDDDRAAAPAAAALDGSRR